MTLTDQTRQIIQLAWSRILGMDDAGFAEAPPDRRIEVIDDDARSVSLVRLFGATALYGPADVVHAGRGLEDEELTQEAQLLAIARRHAPGAKTLGEAQLLYAEEPPPVSPPDGLAVSSEAEHLRQLLGECPADDVAVSGLADAEWAATLVTDRPEAPGENHPVAAAGRQIWQKVIAQLGVLTHPAHRQQGLAAHIGASAAEEAYDDGLIPQWRAAAESTGSLRLAVRLGFTPSGSQTTVLL